MRLLLEPNAPALLKEDGSINWAPDANGNTTWGDADAECNASTLLEVC